MEGKCDKQRSRLWLGKIYHTALETLYYLALNWFHSKDNRGRKTQVCHCFSKRRVYKGSKGMGGQGDTMGEADGNLLNGTRYIRSH